MARYYTIGQVIVLDRDVTPEGTTLRTVEVRGVQDLEAPVSYLIKYPDNSVEWVPTSRLTPQE